MNDILAVVIGVVLGVLASVPVAMMIAASTTRPQRARRDERPALDVPFVELSEPRETSVIVREVSHEL